jgi:hypothetical protein
MESLQQSGLPGGGFVARSLLSVDVFCHKS